MTRSSRQQNMRQQRVPRDFSGLSSWMWSLLPMLGLAGLIILGCWVWLLMTSPSMLPFKRVRVIANYAYIQSPALEQVVQDSINGGFFSLDLKQLKQHLLKQPWIANVALRRVWPDTLMITVYEQNPIARWGENGVVNDQGQVFYPATDSIPSALPLLVGPEGSAPQVLIELNNLKLMLQPLDLQIGELRLSPREAWHAVLSNGVEVTLGRQDVDARFQKFVSLYPKLTAQNDTKIKQVDLRYPNGFAVKWAAQPSVSAP